MVFLIDEADLEKLKKKVKVKRESQVVKKEKLSKMALLVVKEEESKVKDEISDRSGRSSYIKSEYVSSEESDDPKIKSEKSTKRRQSAKSLKKKSRAATMTSSLVKNRDQSQVKSEYTDSESAEDSEGQVLKTEEKKASKKRERSLKKSK